jgi:hypothetical protein
MFKTLNQKDTQIIIDAMRIRTFEKDEFVMK